MTDWGFLIDAPPFLLKLIEERLSIGSLTVEMEVRLLSVGASEFFSLSLSYLSFVSSLQLGGHLQVYT